MKKLLLLFILNILPLAACAESAIINGINYVLYPESKTASVAYWRDTGSILSIYSGDMVIPEEIEYNGDTYTVTGIYNDAFNRAYDLTSISLPKTILGIGQYAFAECKSLTSITIPESVTTIADFAFSDCTGLTSVTIPSSVTSIGEDVFSGCTGLTRIEIPGSVTSVGVGAFYGCTGLTSIEIPGCVTSVGQYAFQNCTGLTAIYLNSLVPPTINSSTFSGVDKSQCTLYVPDGFESKYQSWGFQNIAVNPYVTVEKKAVIYVVDGEEYQRDSVAVTAAITAIDAPTREGYTFSGWSEIPATMPDNDVTVTGTFTINKYAVIYMVDGEEYRRDSVEYGATITLAENPTRDGYIFSGWSGYPETLVMPAGDVVVTGAFEVNGLAKVGAAATSGDEYYDLTGKPLPQPQRGINLVRKADGTTRKIIVR